tara:strand:+ start:278 stop:385 length:108 start_codon:yes stop_codon:yes gene_type:complete
MPARAGNIAKSAGRLRGWRSVLTGNDERQELTKDR